jgi:hypothetical protein
MINKKAAGLSGGKCSTGEEATTLVSWQFVIGNLKRVVRFKLQISNYKSPNLLAPLLPLPFSRSEEVQAVSG